MASEIKVRFNKEGNVIDARIVDISRMKRDRYFRTAAESALRAIRLCQPLRVPPTGYERWKDLQLNFDANEMLEG